MSAFAAAAGALFADPNLGVNALYLAGGIWPAVEVRVIRSSQDRVASALDHDFIHDAEIFDVLVSEVPSMAARDAFMIGETQYTVVGEPRQDEERVTWRCAVRAV